MSNDTPEGPREGGANRHPEDDLTGEFEIPAQPRSASEHVNSASAAVPAADAADSYAEGADAAGADAAAADAEGADAPAADIEGADAARVANGDHATDAAPAEESIAVTRDGEATVHKAVHKEGAPADESPAEVAPAEVASTRVTPVDESPVEAPSPEVASSDVVPAEPASSDVAPVEAASTEVAPVEAHAAGVAPAEATPAEETRPEEAPAEAAPAEAAPAEETRPEATPTEEARAEATPTEETRPGAPSAETAPDASVPPAAALAEPASGEEAEPREVPAATSAEEAPHGHPVTEAYDRVPAAGPAWAPEPAAAGAARPAGPVYVTAPTPPKRRGNRRAGILIALVATVAFAVVDALVVLGLFALNHQGNVLDDLVRYIATPAFWATAIIYALALFLLVAIANRGGWWWYVLGGFLVAVVVYFAYIGATLLTNAWVLAPSEVGRFVSQLWAHPLTIATAVVAREVTIWFGAWIAARGRRVRARNLEARDAYDRELAESRQPVAARP